ncbi:MAG: hypothetical protein GXX09_01940 [Syntrophomonadaceae bacterium]|nr:hypothetical protein [Syntrophomonadaceae bacterium]
MNEIERRIAAIRTDRSRGASELACQALEILRDAARFTQAVDTAGFMQEIQDTAGQLIHCRPAMAAICNCTYRFLTEFINCSRVARNLEELKALSVQAGDDLIASVSAARDRAIRNGASLVKDGDLLASCSYSSSVIQTLKCAAGQGRSFAVLVMQSKWAGRSYGDMTASRLVEYGIRCRVIPDDRVDNHLSGVDFVLLGADTILYDGTLVNGYPSLELVRAAAKHVPPVPVYSVCESTKFYPRDRLANQEEGFDLVSPELLSGGIITEAGIIKPGQIWRYMPDLPDSFPLPAK